MRAEKHKSGAHDAHDHHDAHDPHDHHDHHGGSGGSLRWVGRFIVGMGMLIGVGFGLHTLFMSSYFKVQTIRWEGVQHVDPKALNKQFQSVIGTSLIYLNLEHLHAELLTHRWIKEATIHKVLPNQIDVVIQERVPLAIEIDPKTNKRTLRDEEGIILEEGNVQRALPNVIHYNPRAYQNARALLPLLSERQDAVIDFSSDNDVRVYLSRSGGVLHLGDRDYSERWERFVAVEDDLRRRQRASWEADLRFAGKVVVREGRVS